MKKICYLLTLALTICAGNAFSQYNIKVQIDGLSDSTIYLGNYFGDKQYAKDTAKLNGNGYAVFSGSESLEAGVYFVLLPGNMIFEMPIDKEQKFQVNATYDEKPENITKSMKVKGSSEIAYYIEYQNFMSRMNDKAIPLRKIVTDSEDEKEKEEAKEKLTVLHNEVKDYWDKIHKEAPKSLLSSILYTNKEIDIPESPKDENGEEIDKQFAYKYYKEHYLDYIDFSDARILHSQFYHPKIERYFKQLVVPAPDSIIKECDYIIEKSKANDEVFQYTLTMLFNKYNSSKIMGMDKVFVHLSEKYYLSGEAHWADSAWLDKVRERVIKISPNIIGNKAAEIKYYTNNNEYQSLYMIDADYTIIIFYEPSCGHCKKTVTALKPLTDKFWEKGVETLGMYTQRDKAEWDEFIEKKGIQNWHNGWDPNGQAGFRQFYDVYATPLIYLLDKDKNIIAKRIDVETLEIILNDKFGIENKDNKSTDEDEGKDDKVKDNKEKKNKNNENK